MESLTAPALVAFRESWQDRAHHIGTVNVEAALQMANPDPLCSMTHSVVHLQRSMQVVPGLQVALVYA